MEPHKAVQQITNVGRTNASNEALTVKENLTTCFFSPAGAVAWQTSIELYTLISLQP